MENPNRNFKSQTCEDFIEVLASKAAVPGGGGASALAGAIGIALGNMVGSLTVGKKTYADVEEEIIECKKQADEIAKEFLELMDKDAEAFEPLRVGDRVSARVLKVREDGKLDLSVREKAFLQMDADAAMIMKRMEEYGGKLPFNDKVDPEVIKQEFGLSKNAFKRAVGRLLKEGHIKISEKNIEMKKK